MPRTTKILVIFNRSNMSEATSATKRTIDQVSTLPKGFKYKNDDPKDKIVFGQYVKFEISKRPLSNLWCVDMKNDPEPRKVKLYVLIEHFTDEDQVMLRTIDADLKEAADLLGKKYSPLIMKKGEPAKEEVKLSAYLKLKADRKEKLQKGHLITGKFMLSSVYDYKDYYGVNLIVSQKDKVPSFSKQQEVKPEDENEDEDEE